MGLIGDIKDAAEEVGGTLSDGASTGKDHLSDGVSAGKGAGSEVGNRLYDGGTDLYSSGTSAYGSLADYVQDQGSHVLANPVKTGETMVDFTIGSGEEPPVELESYAEARGYTYYGSASTAKLCQTLIAAIPTLGAITVATAGKATIALAVVGSIGGPYCIVSGVINAYADDAGLGCSFSSIFVYVNHTTLDVFLVPYCT